MNATPSRWCGRRRAAMCGSTTTAHAAPPEWPGVHSANRLRCIAPARREPPGHAAAAQGLSWVRPRRRRRRGGKARRRRQASGAAATAALGAALAPVLQRGGRRQRRRCRQKHLVAEEGLPAAGPAPPPPTRRIELRRLRACASAALERVAPHQFALVAEKHQRARAAHLKHTVLRGAAALRQCEKLPLVTQGPLRSGAPRSLCGAAVLCCLLAIAHAVALVRKQVGRRRRRLSVQQGRGGNNGDCCTHQPELVAARSEAKPAVQVAVGAATGAAGAAATVAGGVGAAASQAAPPSRPDPHAPAAPAAPAVCALAEQTGGARSLASSPRRGHELMPFPPPQPASLQPSATHGTEFTRTAAATPQECACGVWSVPYVLVTRDVSNGQRAHEEPAPLSDLYPA
jgi:hypothetical protein